MSNATHSLAFSRDNGQTDELRHRCGPYRTVQLSGDELWASEGPQPLVLAFRDDDGEWTVCGLDGLRFTEVLIR